nr:hypothetical protein [Tanacetum cinerariifolium]
ELQRARTGQRRADQIGLSVGGCVLGRKQPGADATQQPRRQRQYPPARAPVCWTDAAMQSPWPEGADVGRQALRSPTDLRGRRRAATCANHSSHPPGHHRRTRRAPDHHRVADRQPVVAGRCDFSGLVPGMPGHRRHHCAGYRGLVRHRGAGRQRHPALERSAAAGFSGRPAGRCRFLLSRTAFPSEYPPPAGS